LVATVPPSVVQPMRNQIRFERQSVHLSCNVTGRPTPTVSWTKNGEDLVPSSRVNVRGHELVIAQAAMSDSGIYQCWADNVAGYVTLTARVLVQVAGTSKKLVIRLKTNPIQFEIILVQFSGVALSCSLNVT